MSLAQAPQRRPFFLQSLVLSPLGRRCYSTYFADEGRGQELCTASLKPAIFGSFALQLPETVLAQRGDEKNEACTLPQVRIALHRIPLTSPTFPLHGRRAGTGELECSCYYYE